VHMLVKERFFTNLIAFSDLIRVCC
jgi:hypothetical protein